MVGTIAIAWPFENIWTTNQIVSKEIRKRQSEYPTFESGIQMAFKYHNIQKTDKFLPFNISQVRHFDSHFTLNFQ